MSKVWFSLVLGAVALLGLPGLSSAQHGGHGGGHGGGFHHGGFHHHGFHHGGFHHHGFHYGGVWWYPGYYGGYGASPYYYSYYPYYGSYDYNPYSYDGSSYDWPSQSYDSRYYGSYGGVTSSYPDGYSPATAQPDTSAHVTVSVPADAEIWFEGSKTTSTGSVREYQSPPSRRASATPTRSGPGGTRTAMG